MHPCEPAPPNPDQVFGEHKGVLDALDPHGSSLTSGHFGVALTTRLGPSGVTVYGITHSGSVRFSQQRSLLRPPVTRRYYDEAAAETEQLQTFDESARLLSQVRVTVGVRLGVDVRVGVWVGLANLTLILPLTLSQTLTLTLTLPLTLSLTLTLTRFVVGISTYVVSEFSGWR